MTMTLNLDNLSEAELIALNQQIVAKIRFLRQERTFASMLKFRIGERVSFQPEGRPILQGILTRYNRKSVTVITDQGEHWNVAPSVLFKVVEQATHAEHPQSSKVINLRP